MVFAERAFRDKMNTLADCAVVSLMHVDRMRVLSVMLLHEVSHLAHVLKAPPGHLSRGKKMADMQGKSRAIIA